MANYSGQYQWADRVKKLGWLVGIIIILIIIADQCLKIWVKTHFFLGEEMEILPWFKLKFIENNGFAFGIEWLNKYVLTFGRIIAVVLFIIAMRKLLEMQKLDALILPEKDAKDRKTESEINDKQSLRLPTGFFIAFALIIAGAAGNIFDCVFYGEIFNNPAPPQVAALFPPEGYAPWFEGRVVDMLYFPLFSFDIGYHHYEFFQYIFNIADSAITIGVLLLILFYRESSNIAMASLFNSKKSEK